MRRDKRKPRRDRPNAPILGITTCGETAIIFRGRIYRYASRITLPLLRCLHPNREPDIIVRA